MTRLGRLLKTSLGLAITLTGCTTDLSRFDVVRLQGGDASKQITRAEVAAQGSGTATSGSTGHTISHVSIGGSYARKSGQTAPTGHRVDTGLHGNPRATQ